MSRIKGRNGGVMLDGLNSTIHYFHEHESKMEPKEKTYSDSKISLLNKQAMRNCIENIPSSIKNTFNTLSPTKHRKAQSFDNRHLKLPINDTLNLFNNTELP